MMCFAFLPAMSFLTYLWGTFPAQQVWPTPIKWLKKLHGGGEGSQTNVTLLTNAPGTYPMKRVKEPTFRR